MTLYANVVKCAMIFSKINVSLDHTFVYVISLIALGFSLQNHTLKLPKVII